MFKTIFTHLQLLLNQRLIIYIMLFFRLEFPTPIILIYFRKTKCPITIVDWGESMTISLLIEFTVDTFVKFNSRFSPVHL